MVYESNTISLTKVHDGINKYVHIMYSTVSNPTDADISTAPAEYMGICVDDNKEAPTQASKYTWNRVRGLDGIDGIDGIQGPAGENGKTTYFHIRYSSVSQPENASQMTEIPSTYIGTYVDFNAEDSNNPKAYTWSRFQGLKGEQGIPGIGIDGKTSYLHIAYANSADGKIGFSVSESAGKTYIGQYTDFIVDDSKNPSDYKWTLIKGDKGDTGEQGIQGVPGKDGTPSYFYIRYSQNANGNPMTTSAVGAIYIGVCSTSSETAPTTPNLYSWSKIRGEDGDDGVSITDVTNYYLATTLSNNVTESTHGWTTEIQTIDATKKYLWNYEEITGSGGVQLSKTTPCIIGVYGDKGNTGLTGNGIKGITEHYQISASNTIPPTSWEDTLVNTTTTQRYLWNYETITYTDNTTYDTIKRVIGTHGETGAQGEQGIPGIDGEDGRTSYLHVKYSNDGISFTANNGETPGKYIGTYVDFEINDSSKFSDYTWAKIEGPQGIQGPKGDDGKQYYTWLKYADTPTSGMSDSPVGKDYIGLAYNKLTPDETSNYSDYSWSLIKGEKGDTGLTGGKGEDGKTYYTWIKYASSASGENMSDSPVGKTYIGIAYNKPTITESNIASDYIWSLIQGSKGENGADGETYYVHIKYSNDGGKTFSGESGAYIGIYTDTNPEPLNDVTAYVWNRIAGNDGLSMFLSNDSHNVPTDSSGNNGNYSGAVTEVFIYEGSVDVTKQWEVTATPSSGITGTFVNNIYTVKTVTVDSGYVDFAATKNGQTLTRRFVVTRTKSGKDATAYWLMLDNTIVRKEVNGTYTPNIVTALARSQTGINTITDYQTTFKIFLNNSTTPVYISPKAESIKTYTIPENTTHILIQMCNGDTVLDEQNVNVVTDGQNGTNGKTYTLTILGETTSILYDYTGKSPAPATLSPFKAELWEDGKLITQDIQYEWSIQSVNSVLTATSNTSATFTPKLSYNYDPETQYSNGVCLKATYKEQIIFASLPIIVQKSSAPGANAIVMALSNDSHVVPTDADGNNGDYSGAETVISIYEGTNDVTTNWTITANASTGITGTLSGNKYKVTKITVDSGYVDLIATKSGNFSIQKRFQISRVKGGAAGSSGVDAFSYWFTVDNTIIKKDIEGILSVPSINITARCQSGSSEVTAYPARFQIFVDGISGLKPVPTSVNNNGIFASDVVFNKQDTVENGILVFNKDITPVVDENGILTLFMESTESIKTYESKSDESTLTYEIPEKATKIQIKMYQAGGANVLLDEQTVYVISDGLPGTSGKNAVSAVLDNDSHTIPMDSNGENGNYLGALSTIYIYEGNVDASSNWNVTVKASPGIEGKLVGKTYTVTKMTTDTGYVDFTATRAGYDNITKRFQLATSKVGADGITPPSYWLLSDTTVIRKDNSGNIFPKNIVFSAKIQTEADGISYYAGRYKIYKNGSSTATYTSVTDELNKSFAITSDVESLKVELYKAGGTTTLLDTQSVYVIHDGEDGIQGSDGYTVFLTNENELFTCDKNGNILESQQTTTDIVVYKGAEVINATIGTLPTVPGLTINKNGKTVVIIANTGTLLAEKGNFNIPISADGKTFQRTFSWAKFCDATEIGKDLANTKETIKDIKLLVDEQAQTITGLVSKTEINTYIENNKKVTEMHTQISQQQSSIEGFTSDVSDLKTRLEGDEKTISGHTTSIKQTADKLSLIATGGDGESSIVLTETFISLVSSGIVGIKAQELNIDSVATFMNSLIDGSKTIINAGSISTDNVNALLIRTGRLTSANFQDSVTTVYSTEGTSIDMNNGAIKAKNFAIDSNGNAFFKGTGNFEGKIVANEGQIGGINGFTIQSQKLYSGMTSFTDTTHDGVYIGTDGIALGKGKFKVGSDGIVNATGGIFNGTITAQAGSSFGPWHISNDSIWNGSSAFGAYNGLYFGTSGLSIKSNFKVDSNGRLTALQGLIGGFEITTNSLYHTQNAFGGNGVYVSPNGISVGDKFKASADGVDVIGKICATSITAKDSYSIYYNNQYDGTIFPNSKTFARGALDYEDGMVNFSSLTIGEDIDGENSSESCVTFQRTRLGDTTTFIYGQNIIMMDARSNGKIYGILDATYDKFVVCSTKLCLQEGDGDGASEIDVLRGITNDAGYGIWTNGKSPSTGTPCVYGASSRTGYTSDGIVDLGFSGGAFKTLYVKGISLNGDYRTEWPNEGKSAIVWRPSVSSSGVISWTNNNSSSVPSSVNIKGPKGDPGTNGIDGSRGPQGPQGIQGPKGDGTADGVNISPLHITIAKGNALRIRDVNNLTRGMISIDDTNTGLLGNPNINITIQGKTVHSMANVISDSDVRLKKDFRNLDIYENFFMDIEPVSFRFKTETSNKYHIGVKAQQVLESLEKNGLSKDDFAGYDESVFNKNLYSNINDIPNFDIVCGIGYTEFTSLNTYMTQKAHHRLDFHDSEINELKTKNIQLLNICMQLQGEIAILKQQMEEHGIC